ncbi:MAG TPA: fibronectin type III domain-containing protein [Gemmatimonadaceae bacterium]|nr:fibronectin type III domain-containing protein [Gemmatimonadaceae bacterium]
MPSWIRPIAARVTLVAALSLLFVTACDPTATNDPGDQTGLLVTDASRAVSVGSLTASAVSWNEIDLTWPTTGGVTGYQIFRSTTGVSGAYTQLTTITSNTGSYADRAVDGSREYCYQVRSYKTAGRNTNYSGFTSAVCATTPAPPPPPIVAPSEVQAVPQANRILINWKDNSSNEDGFRVERTSSLSGESYAVPVSANTTSFSWGGSAAEQQWCFRVTAFNATASSLPSTSDCTIVPATPTDLSATASDAQSITLNWSDNSAYEDGYKIFRSTQAAVWTEIATLPANAVTYRDLAVTADITYAYHVQALKDGGYSDVSNDAAGVIPTSLPEAPHDAGAAYSIAGDGRMYYLGISWIDASSNEAGFIIEFDDGISGWTGYADVPANGGPFFQLFGSEDYSPSGCFRVIAYNALGTSAPSNVTCADPTSVIQQIIGGANSVSGATAPTRPTIVKKGRATNRKIK